MNTIKYDKTHYGAKSSWKVISQQSQDGRQLFDNAHICPALAQVSIAHAGIMKAESSYEVLRVHQSGTFFLACIEGEGEVLINGRWQTITSNSACILPPFVTNAFRTSSPNVWKFAWVRYSEVSGKKTIASHPSPILGSYDSSMLAMVIEGLEKELLSSQPSEQVSSSWVRLIHQYVLKLSKPTKLDSRLSKVLKHVVQDLSEPWTLTQMADIAALSPEHLRRLFNSQLGKSPMQQLISMRMMMAKNLIIQTDETLENIARQCGYQSVFSFSNTFKKWMGYTPSKLRA